MASYLLDTNHVTYLMQGVAQVVAAYRRVIHAGDEIVLSPAVSYEIVRGLREHAVSAAARKAGEARLRRLVRGWRRAPIGTNAAAHASMVWVERRARGPGIRMMAMH